jgi:hypothetical protein
LGGIVKALRFLGLLACSAFAALPAQSAVAEDEELKTFLLSDEQIQEKCRASIAGRVDMVEIESTDEEGEVTREHIPRCVLVYNTVQDTTGTYLDEAEAANEIAAEDPGSAKEARDDLDDVADAADEELGELEALNKKKHDAWAKNTFGTTVEQRWDERHVSDANKVEKKEKKKKKKKSKAKKKKKKKK